MPRIKRSAVTVQKPFPVLLLPPELRNRIWRYAVVNEGDIRVQKHFRQKLASKLQPSRLRSGRELRLHQQDDQRRVSSKLAVAFTCRQLYLEVTPIYYRENIFYFPFVYISPFRFKRNPIKEFVGAIGSENTASILSHRTDGCLLLDGYHPYFPGTKRLMLTNTMDLTGRRVSRGWISRMIFFVQTHPSTIVTCNGKVWGLQDWISYAKKAGVMGNW